MIRFRNETTNKLGGLSLMGGAEIMIDGTGFDSQAPNHLIKFKSQNTGLTEMTLIGPAMSGKFSFQDFRLQGPPKRAIFDFCGQNGELSDFSRKIFSVALFASFCEDFKT